MLDNLQNGAQMTLQLLVTLVLSLFSCTLSEENEICLEQFRGSCSLYLAPSTIPKAGLGVFTTKPLNKGDLLLPAGELDIPIVDLGWHTGFEHIFWPLRRYTWNKLALSDEDTHARDSLQTYGTGFDSILNSYMLLENVRSGKSQHDLLSLKLGKDPGASGISPYWNATYHAIRNVPPGGELFNFYGEKWFLQREYYLGKIPLKDDYRIAQQMVNKFDSLKLPNALKEAVWKSVVMNSTFESRTLNALPSFEDLQTVARMGMHEFHQQRSIRDETDLMENGRCLDNMIAAPSTIPQAGRGAFATRFLPKDSIITGSPLILVSNRSHLYMYGINQTDPKQFRNTSDFIGHQLLLNYCMGHTESSLLLCPYGSTVNYINHNQTRANVRLQWTEHGMMSHNSSYLTLPISQLERNQSTNLVIDYVALRDIRVGEELLLDYGDDFETAWTKHVEAWNTDDYATANEFNDKEESSELRTMAEQVQDPYPAHLQTTCDYSLKRRSWKTVFDPLDSSQPGYPCEVLSRNATEDGGKVYSVRLVYDVGSGGDTKQIRIPVEREGVPREAIKFAEKMTVPVANAFRHEIGIPDKMFPLVWKDIKKVES